MKKIVLAASLLLTGVMTADASSPPPVRSLLKGVWHVTINGNEAVIVTISPGGTVKAVQPNGDKDTGHWRFSNSEKVCVTFNRWLDRKEHCSALDADSATSVHGEGFSAHR